MNLTDLQRMILARCTACEIDSLIEADGEWQIAYARIAIQTGFSRGTVKRCLHAMRDAEKVELTAEHLALVRVLGIVPNLNFSVTDFCQVEIRRLYGALFDIEGAGRPAELMAAYKGLRAALGVDK